MKTVPGIKYGSYHTDSWGLYLTDLSVSAPEYESKIIYIPGASNPLDGAEVLGKLQYKIRKLSASFAVKCSAAEGMLLYDTICSRINGKRLNIVFDVTPDRYWIGRTTVSGSWENGIETIKFKSDVNPYQTKDIALGDDWLWDPFCFEDDIIQSGVPSSVTLAGNSTSVSLTGYGKFSCYPVFTSSADGVEVSDGKTTYILAAKIPKKLPEFTSNKTYTLYGTGTVTIQVKGEIL